MLGLVKFKIGLFVTSFHVFYTFIQLIFTLIGWKQDQWIIMKWLIKSTSPVDNPESRSDYMEHNVYIIKLDYPSK